MNEGEMFWLMRRILFFQRLFFMDGFGGGLGHLIERSAGVQQHGETLGVPAVGREVDGRVAALVPAVQAQPFWPAVLALPEERFYLVEVASLRGNQQVRLVRALGQKQFIDVEWSYKKRGHVAFACTLRNFIYLYMQPQTVFR